jgi:hypothetical protein
MKKQFLATVLMVIISISATHALSFVPTSSRIQEKPQSNFGTSSKLIEEETQQRNQEAEANQIVEEEQCCRTVSQTFNDDGISITISARSFSRYGCQTAEIGAWAIVFKAAEKAHLM